MFNENSEESFERGRCQFDLEKFDLDNFMNSTIKNILVVVLNLNEIKKYSRKSLTMVISSRIILIVLGKR